MRKYQLSRQYRLTTAEDIADTESATTVQLKKGDIYGLLDSASGECLIVNSTMHLFLTQYQTPKTLQEVAIVFAELYHATTHEVLPIVEQFFKEMKERGVIVSLKVSEKFEIITAYPVGTLMDGYRIEENLSVNLPLEVYKATDTKTDKPVILKMLRIPTHLSDKWRTQWREKFRKEFDSQKILRGYSHICQLIDLTPDYAVLEWAEGISLRRRLAEGAPLDTVLREQLLVQLIDSYAFMHTKNILHGDVHARNILVSEANQIKIIDFDLAHQLTETNAFPPVRGGAAEFVPPENVRFDAFNIVKGKANYRTEVYQLGIIAYWMTYGKVPFTGDVWQDLATNILNKKIDFPLVSNNNDALSLDMRAFLKKCLAKNPKTRFASANEMAMALKQLLHEEN